MAKLTEQDVLLARQMRSEGMTYRTISERIGMSYTATHYVINGKTWGDLPMPDNLPRHAPRWHVPDEVVEQARIMRDEEGATWRQIERTTGFTRMHLMNQLPRRSGRNHEPHLPPEEADEAIRLRRSGLSWTKLARHFDGRISRMGLYYAWRDKMKWWREAEARVDGA